MTAAVRRALWPLSLAYSAGTALRRVAYDRGLRRVERLAVPVVSVGNLTVGGTGKTPLVIWLVEQARLAGRRPGVLARGYGRAKGAALNDEGALLAARFPDLPQVQDPDRVAGGRRLCAVGDVDLVILDDGFQHRRLHRDLDLVCVDAREPFDGGLQLPAGDLRESPRALRRADAVVLTRASRASPIELADCVRRVVGAAGRALPVHAADHRALDLVERPSGQSLPLDALAARRVHLLSAIARPATFAETVAALGATVVRHRIEADHHIHDPAVVRRLADAAAQDRALLIVTEKDEVKLHGLDVPRLVLRIALRFRDEPPDLGRLGIA